MALFWQRGYLDTSMEDLVAHTGVSRYGIYSEFDSKRGLFMAALDLYIEAVVSLRIGPLEAPDAGAEQIRQFWQFLNELADLDIANWGCLMCNSATELGPLDREVEIETGAYLERMINGFANALTNAVARGELTNPPDDVTEYAEYMGVMLLGVSAAGRIERGLAAVKPAARQILKQLR